MLDIKATADVIHETAVEKGWWDTPRSFGDVMMMIVSECAEAVEHYREGHELNKTWYERDNKPDGVPTEMADIIIRVLDACVQYDIDIEKAIDEKFRYNKTREYRHGNKLL